MGGQYALFGLRFGRAVDVQRRGSVAFHVRTLFGTVENEVAGKRDQRQAAGSAQLRDDGGADHILTLAFHALGLGVVDPDIPGRVDDRPRPHLVQSRFDGLENGDVHLAPRQQAHRDAPFGADSREGLSKRPCSSNDRERCHVCGVVRRLLSVRAPKDALRAAPESWVPEDRMAWLLPCPELARNPPDGGLARLRRSDVVGPGLVEVAFRNDQPVPVERSQ